MKTHVVDAAFLLDKIIIYLSIYDAQRINVVRLRKRVAEKMRIHYLVKQYAPYSPASAVGFELVFTSTAIVPCSTPPSVPLAPTLPSTGRPDSDG